MAVETLATDMNDRKGQNDLERQVEAIREAFAKSHKSGAVENLIPKNDPR